MHDIWSARHRPNVVTTIPTTLHVQPFSFVLHASDRSDRLTDKMSNLIRNKTSRQSFRAADKIKVIKFAEAHGNRAAGREFDVNEANVRLWRRQKERLEKMPRSKKADRHGAAAFPEMESQLIEWVHDRRQQGIDVSINEVLPKTLLLAKMLPGNETFKASHGWHDVSWNVIIYRCAVERR